MRLLWLQLFLRSGPASFLCMHRSVQRSAGRGSQYSDTACKSTLAGPRDNLQRSRIWPVLQPGGPMDLPLLRPRSSIVLDCWGLIITQPWNIVSPVPNQFRQLTKMFLRPSLTYLLKPDIAIFWSGASRQWRCAAAVLYIFGHYFRTGC